MAPSPLALESSDIDIDHAATTSPAINIQHADRFPASPWNEYDTNWKFSAPDIDARNSAPYTPSYNGSFNSWGSHSVSWGGRENSDPIKMYEEHDFLMNDATSRRQHHRGPAPPDDDYNPSHYDGDIVVGDMDGIQPTSNLRPQLSFTPALPSFVAHQEHSPAFSGASASSPGSDIDLSNNNGNNNNNIATHSRASSVSSSPSAELSATTFNAALSFDTNPTFAVGPPPPSPGIKPRSPPALVIPGEDGGRLAPPQHTHAAPSSPSPSTARPGLSAPGVSIHIVPSTPVGGLDVAQGGPDPHARDGSYQQMMDQTGDMPQDPRDSRSNDQQHQSWGHTPSATSNPGSHPPTPHYHSRTDSSPFHSRSGSGSHASSPAFSPRPQMDFTSRIDFNRVSSQTAASSNATPSFAHRSPALSSGTSSLHGSPHLGHLDMSPSPRTGVTGVSVPEFLLPDSDPGVPRPRSASERVGGRAWQDVTLGLDYGGHTGLGGLSLTGMDGARGQAGTVDPSDVLPPSGSGGSGRDPYGRGDVSNNNNNQSHQHQHQQHQAAQFATPHPYENPLLHPRTAAATAFTHATGSEEYLSPGPVSLRRVKSENPHVPTHRRNVKSEDLRVPPSQHLDFLATYRGGNGGGSGSMSNLLAPPGAGAGGLGLMNIASAGKHRRGHDRHSSLGSHGHTSVRSSPYPSPSASPARVSHGLPDVGGGMGVMSVGNIGGGGGGGMNVFETYGAGAAGPDSGAGGGGIGGIGGMMNTTNPPRRLVTTKATHDASSARRKNEPGFTCPVPGCGSTFTRSFNLKGHLRSHNEERPFKCKWPGCEKGFARQHDCKRHEALHLNIRPYTCAGCRKTFARMDALNRHLRSEGGAECALHEQPLQSLDSPDHRDGNANANSNAHAHAQSQGQSQGHANANTNANASNGGAGAGAGAAHHHHGLHRSQNMMGRASNPNGDLGPGEQGLIM